MAICVRRLSCVTVGDVLAVDQDAAALGVVEMQQQVDQRRLAGAGRPDQPDPLARRDAQVDAVQHAAAPRTRACRP